MSSTFTAIVNPAAGGGRSRIRFPALLADLRRAGLEVEVLETGAPGDATRLAREAYAAGRRRFLAVGGDGTTFEVVNGLLPREEGAEPPSLGILPLGTGNSFLRDFDAAGPEAVVRAVVEGRTRSCDVIAAAHRGGTLYSLNLISLGFVAEVCALANARFKGLGETGYTLATLIRLARLRTGRFPLRVDDGPEDRAPLTLLSFNNSRFTGGKMLMAPAADPGDGWGDLIRMEAVGRLTLLRAFRRIFQGTHVELPAVRASRFRRITLALDGPVPVMIDGEVFDLWLERLEVLPAALRVWV